MQEITHKIRDTRVLCKAFIRIPKGETLKTIPYKVLRFPIPLRAQQNSEIKATIDAQNAHLVKSPPYLCPAKCSEQALTDNQILIANSK